MNIIKSKQFQESLTNIVLYIAKDSKSRAKDFKDKLYIKVDSLIHMPYKFRKSYYHDSSDVRDLIFKGYTIPYLIDVEKKVIVLLDIFKWSDKKQK